MASKITFDDKSSLTTSSLPRSNKCTDSDLNEIKQVVNENADELSETTQKANKISVNITTGQEVATNEYIDGKQVYVKRYNIGNLPDNNRKRILHGLNNVIFRRMEGEAYDEAQGIFYPLPFPYKTYSDVNSDAVSIWIWQDYIEVMTFGDKHNFTGFVNLYYTKNN